MPICESADNIINVVFEIKDNRSMKVQHTKL